MSRNGKNKTKGKYNSFQLYMYMSLINIARPHTNSLVLYNGQVTSNGEKLPECVADIAGLSRTEWKSEDALVLASY